MRWTPMKVAWAIFFGLALALVTLPLWAAPKAESPHECNILADFWLVMSALAKHGIAHDRAVRIAIPDIYSVKDNERAVELFALVGRAAYAYIEQKQGQPQDFSKRLHMTCMATGGNLDGVLGVRL